MSLYKGTSSNASLLILYILYILYDIVLHTRTLGQITGIEPEALIIKIKKTKGNQSRMFTQYKYKKPRHQNKEDGREITGRRTDLR